MQHGKALGLLLICIAERLRENGAEDPSMQEALASNGPLGEFLRGLDEDGLEELAEEAASAISAAAGEASRGSAS